MHSGSVDLRDPVFEAFGVCFSVQVVTSARVYGIDLAQTSAREEEPAFVVRAAGLVCEDAPQRAPGAVLLRIEPEAGGALRVRLRAKAPEPIRCTRLLLRGLAPPLEDLALPAEGGAPLLTLRCGGELLAVRLDPRSLRDTQIAVALERSGERAGQGVLELGHAPDPARLAREHEAPTCAIARGDAARRLLERASVKASAFGA